MNVAQKHSPELIIMDIVMPGANGFQATRALRRSVDTADIPIIMMSTKNQNTDRILGLRQGAIDYLIKPVKRLMLLKSVALALESV